MRDWLIFASAGALTYLTRASFLLLGERFRLPDRVQRSLRYVAPAAFAGISAPAVLGDGLGTAELSNIVAAVVALLAVWKTRNVVVCMVAGMATLWISKWLGI